MYCIASDYSLMYHLYKSFIYIYIYIYIYTHIYVELHSKQSSTVKTTESPWSRVSTVREMGRLKRQGFM
jgi:hypothetical protein